MVELITLCGDNCRECPRYIAQSTEELQKVAELWYRVLAYLEEAYIPHKLVGVMMQNKGNQLFYFISWCRNCGQRFMLTIIKI